MPEAESFWEPPDEEDPYLQMDGSPATEAQIREWEGRTGHRLPATLAKALTVQDGGRVFGTSSFDVNSLDGFSMLDDEQWDEHFAPGNQEDEEFEGVDRSQFVMIGDCYGCGIVLDYRRGSEPKVVLMEHNLGGILRDHKLGTFDEFVGGLQR